MKSKILFLGLILFLCGQSLKAQTMSDAQIISYIQQRSAAGVDAKTIGTELLTRGASQEQLSRLYGSHGSAASTAGGAARTDVNRSRSNNGEKVPSSAPTSVSGRQIFGHDIFRSQKLSFEPNMSMPVAPTYQLGPGDELIVDVYGASQVSNTLRIASDGTANIPRIGPVEVSGLTVEQAQSRIRKAMGEHYQNSTIKVTVGQTRTISISVMGEVATPGNYTLTSFASVFHALYMAGGINEVGTLREVKVARNGKIISTIDVYQYILDGRLAGDVKLQDNDVIIVGSYVNLVNVSGCVKRPMWYEMKKGETLDVLFRYCSGFTGNAYSQSVKVNRSAGDQLSVYSVDEVGYSTFALLDGDVVSVGSNEQRYSNSVTIGGAVKRPGQYEVTVVNTLKALIEKAGGLQEDALTNRAVLVRMNEDRTRSTITLDLAGILNGTAPDVVLQNEDVIEIASLAPWNDEHKMYIDGEVWNPGAYAFSQHTTIEDLITMAGGLRESASLLNVEVSRRIIDPKAASDIHAKSEIFTFNLSEGLNTTESNDFELKPYDHVFIRRSPVFQPQRTVSISGEVVFAGNYTLKDDKVRLSDVVNNAGGLKLHASAHDARLIRRMNATERARARQLIELASNASDSISITPTDFVDTYTVAIDLSQALNNPGGKHDILLRDGDQLIVPKQLSTVRIGGEVLYPNNVSFVKGKGYRYYINEAGGFTKNSLKRRAYIVYANGHVSKLSKGKIEPGCEIVVPVKEKKTSNVDFGKWATIITSITSITALLITAIK